MQLMALSNNMNPLGRSIKNGGMANDNEDEFESG